MSHSPQPHRAPEATRVAASRLLSAQEQARIATLPAGKFAETILGFQHSPSRPQNLLTSRAMRNRLSASLLDTWGGDEDSVRVWFGLANHALLYEPAHERRAQFSANNIKADLGELQSPARDATYEQLLQESEQLPQSDQWAGWASVFSYAADDVFARRAPEYAYRLAVAGWRFKSRLDGTPESAGLLAHLAQLSANSLAHSGVNLLIRDYEAASDRIDHASSALRQRGGPKFAIEHLRLGLAAARLHQIMHARTGASMMKSTERRYNALIHALESYNASEDSESLDEARRGDAATAMVSLRIQLIFACVASGDLDLANHHARPLADTVVNVVQLADYHIALAHCDPNLNSRVSAMTRAAKAVRDLREQVRPAQRRRPLVDLSKAATHISKSLKFDHRGASASMWAYAAAQWKNEADQITSNDGAGDQDSLVDEQSTASEETVDSTLADSSSAGGTEVGRLALIRRAIDSRRPIAYIMAAEQLAHVLEWSTNASNIVDSRALWNELRREICLIDEIVIQDEQPGSSLITSQESILRTALILSERFAQYRSCDLWLQLGALRGLDLEKKVAALDSAVSSATVIGRVNTAVSARVDAIVALLTGGGAVFDVLDVRVTELEQGLVAGIASGSSTDALDMVSWGVRETRRLTATLAEAGHAALAIRVLRASSGLLSAALTERPGLLEDYASLEQSRINEAAGQDLAARMLQHLIDSDQTHLRALVPSAGLGHPRSRSLALYFLPQDECLWVFIEDTKLHADQMRLPLTRKVLRSYIARLWYELRPSRQGLDVNALASMWSNFIAPIFSKIIATDRLELCLFDEMSRVPLHCARDARGRYLIQEFEILYRVAERPLEIEERAEGALVGGWEDEILATREAVQVGEILNEHNIRTLRPTTGAAGREELLNPDMAVKILHIAGHGETYQWPLSLNSYIQLDRDVTITAAEWMREGLKASFAFINTCNLGQIQFRDGDINGFPLALIIRGARSVVAATAPVNPGHAHDFAIRFWNAVAYSNRDSVGAFRDAMCSAIDEGLHPSAWASYSMIGDGVRLLG